MRPHSTRVRSTSRLPRRRLQRSHAPMATCSLPGSARGSSACCAGFRAITLPPHATSPRPSPLPLQGSAAWQHQHMQRCVYETFDVNRKTQEDLVDYLEDNERNPRRGGRPPLPTVKADPMVIDLFQLLGDRLNGGGMEANHGSTSRFRAAWSGTAAFRLSRRRVTSNYPC